MVQAAEGALVLASLRACLRTSFRWFIAMLSLVDLPVFGVYLG